MINGIIYIYKQEGYTSHDVVAKMRGILKQKKIGHTGTLDPDATGVLPVCLGTATKLCDILTDKSKEYVADFVLGKETDTQDISGKVIRETKNLELDEEEVIKCIQSFIGEYMQVPPMYSAKKIEGKTLVDLARQGIEVERKAVKVEIKELEILGINLPFVKIRVFCSKGTYIRTLCHDIGKKLSCGACMTKLCRTRSDRFLLKDAISLEELEALKNNNEKLESYVLPVDKYFDGLPYLKVKKQFYKQAINGNKLETKQIENFSFEILGETKKFRLYTDDEKFLGIYEYTEKELMLKPYKLFIGEIQ